MSIGYFISTGILLGFGQGWTPGPHSALVVSAAIQHQFRQASWVAFGPVAAAPLILGLTVPLVAWAGKSQFVLGIIGVAGGAFLLYLAYENLSLKSFKLSQVNSSGASLGKGALTALLSPHPYLFWMTAGSTLLLDAWNEGPMSAISFLSAFLVFFYLAKLSLAMIVVKSRKWMGTTGLTWIVRVLGLIFGFYAILLIQQGMEMLG